MHQTYSRTPVWTALAALFALFALSTAGAPSWASSVAPAAAAPASSAPAAAVSPAVLAMEPPAVRRLIEQANALESNAAEEDDESRWQAASLYCEASRHGSIEGQYRLGMLYAFGSGVPESRKLAASLFSMASSQGHAEANKMLDTIQMTSHDLPACVVQAILPQKLPPRPPKLVGSAMREPSTNVTGDAPPLIDRFVLSLPERKRWIVPLVNTVGEWYGIDPKLVLSVIAVESNFEIQAQSPKAAMGLMQLIPDTAERFNVKNAYDATQNLRGGVAYLRWLLSYYRGNIIFALAAYNAGEGRVDRYKGIPPFPETRNYVQKVVELYGRVVHAFDESITAASPMLTLPTR